MISFMNSNSIMKTVNSFVISLPAPKNISYWWNFGSLLGLCLILQIITGIFLALHFLNDSDLAFNSIIHMMREVNGGWVMRLIHMNGASFFFFCLYFHISRSLYYESYSNKATWMSGMTIFLLTMMTAFMGYVLPWGQMSFWGVTVITSLFSAFPYIGESITMWIWGGFSVEAPTLNRFFSFHFLIPFIIAALVALHLIFLHQENSSNPLGLKSDYLKVIFHPFFSLKDLVGFLIFFLLMSMVVFFYPWMFSDPENFIPANSMMTPHKIVPEWYFLFAYAILRSIPNKLGGVLAMFASILVMYLLPLFRQSMIKGKNFNPFGKLFFSLFVMSFLLLTWIGGQPAEGLYILVGQINTMFYFFYLLTFMLCNNLWFLMLSK